MRNHADGIILVGIKQDVCFYYDHKHNDSFCIQLSTKRANHYFRTPCSKELAEWGENQINKYLRVREEIIARQAPHMGGQAYEDEYCVKE